MRYALLAVLVSLAGAATAAAADPPLVEREWKIDGVTRQALIYVPATPAKDASAKADSAKAAPAKTDSAKDAPAKEGMPLVFAFHGHGGTMKNAAEKFAYHKLWPEALVVYMQGLPCAGKTDPEGKLPGWQNKVDDQDGRDLKFFDEVLATLTQEQQVDKKRIYVTGHSNGGVFTYLLWAVRGSTFAAVAPSASLTVRHFKDLKPLPALHVAGEKDEIVPFASQKRMMDAVRTLNGCDTEGKPWATAGPLVGTLYPSKTGTPFVSVIYPGPHKLPDEAPGLIVKFFKENVKK